MLLLIVAFIAGVVARPLVDKLIVRVRELIK